MFNGDQVSLNYILQTLERKQIAIPGVTTNPNLSVSAAGEVAYYYERGASSVAKGNLGAKMDFTSSGGKRVDIPMTNAIQIKAVLPHVNYATVSADIVGDKVVQESIEAANLHNTEFLLTLEGSEGAVTGTTALTKTTVYAAIVDAIKEFKTLNKAKGMKPSAVVVGPTVAALLLQAPEFIRSSQRADGVVYEGLIGKVSGLDVVEAVDMDESTSKIDFIVMHYEGVAAPTNVNTLYVTDATAAGYPGGTLISGEIGYGFKLADKNLVLVRKHA